MEDVRVIPGFHHEIDETVLTRAQFSSNMKLIKKITDWNPTEVTIKG
jgi:hypothetical protein